MSERMQTTINHFKTGVISMGRAAAQHSIDSWQSELKDYEGAVFATIVSDLGRLRSELEKDDIDGNKIAKLLTKLGKETTRAASLASDKHSLVAQLGAELEKAASKLEKEAAKPS